MLKYKDFYSKYIIKRFYESGAIGMQRTKLKINIGWP